MECEYLTLVESLGRFPLFYEVYPALIEGAGDTHEQWFEIALHLEVREHRPHVHPENQEGSLLLIGLADVLVQRVKSHAPFALDMQPAYYTLHPAEPEDRNEPRIALTLSLIFTGLGPYTSRKKPALLTQLRAELELLGIRNAIEVGCKSKN